jgi:hypothetical protein
MDTTHGHATQAARTPCPRSVKVKQWRHCPARGMLLASEAPSGFGRARPPDTKEHAPMSSPDAESRSLAMGPPPYTHDPYTRIASPRGIPVDQLALDIHRGVIL